MKVEELRIGNFIKVDDLPIEQVTLKTFATLLKFPATISCFNPVPLDDEWLEKFGWLKDIDKNGNVEYIKPLCNFSIRYAIDYFAEYQFRIISQFKYVHQLQNLYYVITRSELVLAVTPINTKTNDC